jgi:hypothetical protein
MNTVQYLCSHKVLAYVDPDFRCMGSRRDMSIQHLPQMNSSGKYLRIKRLYKLNNYNINIVRPSRPKSSLGPEGAGAGKAQPGTSGTKQQTAQAAKSQAILIMLPYSALSCSILSWIKKFNVFFLGPYTKRIDL